MALSIAGVGILAGTLGVALLLAERSGDTNPKANPQPNQLPNPYGLECPEGDLIADVENEVAVTAEGGAPTARGALNRHLRNEPGLMAATPRENPNRSNEVEIEFVFEAEGARIGRAVVESLLGNWYVTSYVACSSAQ
jgi:hypothetical protein